MKKYVILDIDRTIINGTSWYHACSCPNLLIDEYNIDRFKELNNKMYVHGTSKDRYEFRKQTFELINKRVSESAYSKLSECGCADEILIGQNVNEVFFEAVGIYTYKKLMKSDEDCKKIVDFIYKYYFGDIEFIFLTSGYEPFMKGLVKEYMKSFHKNCTWRTIGSTIKFSNGCIYLKEVMTQEKKFQFVKKIIDYGNRVVFLADDSVEEKELFSVVFRNGGYAFNVRYDEKLHESNWHELINDIEDENVFLSYLMKNSEVALSDCKKVQNNFFRLHMNEIGVICLNDIEYQIFLGSFNRDKKIVEYIKKVSHKKEEKYYLRGRYYYYWLPSYITGSLESKYAGWKKIVIISLNEALINGSIDNRQLKDLAKKILNINKYKTVMLNELSINMMENGYDTIHINRIKELADLLYAEWSDYVTVSVSKIKRKRFDSPEAVTESIEKMEDEIVSITKGYIDFLEKDEGTDRENKKISNEIIFVEEGKIIFSITDGKTHNFWFEDKAPKYPLLKNCNDDKIFAKARILFNQESEENLYQAGIYVKSAEDKVYYMAIDNDRNCILDTIGENNRKEEFNNTNEYLIKMNLEADCLKVQFISDASTKELKMMIERLAPVEVGLMVKTWGNGGFLEVDFKESQAIISNK